MCQLFGAVGGFARLVLWHLLGFLAAPFVIESAVYLLAFHLARTNSCNLLRRFYQILEFDDVN